MHRIVPELIVENYRNDQFQGEFPALGMFLDLSGFSKMTDSLMQHGQHGAEVLAGLMHGVFDPLVESIFGHGGKIVSFAGDGILALYPVHGSPRDVMLSALASAWGVQKKLLENPEQNTVYGKFPLSVKIGLTFGSVAWRILRSKDGEQATYYFRGSAVDDSAHAEHHASAGDIVLTETFVNVIRDDILVEPVDEYYRLVDFLADMPGPSTYVPGPVDLEVSRIFMPEDVIVHDIRGEFRQIVNVFMSIPDLTDDQLADFIDVVFGLRKEYGGLLTRIDFGDKGCNLLLLWGAPVAYENDVNRALSFILDLQEKVDFPITTGVTYYVAHAGYLGGEMCEDYTCYGWGVNLAARFMMAAPEGAIWVDERVARKVSQRFELEQIGSQQFKGFAFEQKVAELHKRRGEVDPIYQGEIVGREQEIAQLQAFALPLWGGKFAGVIGVSGDAGIGKGRLIHAFQDDQVFIDHSCLWMNLQADDILKQSFKPIQRWLVRYFNLNADDFMEARQAAFNQKLDELFASISDYELIQELYRTRSFLAALLEIHIPNSLYQVLDAEGRYNNTILSLIALLKAESLRQPLIVFVDDYHNIDPDSVKLLSILKQSLLTSTTPYPIGLILAYRKSGLDATAAADLVDTELALGGLSEKGIARLAGTILGGDVSRELISLVKTRSEGNPYFAEQVIRYLQDENLLEISLEGWRQVTHGRQTLLPGDIRALLVARLDQLVHDVKSVVQTASILGREFELNVLSQMLSGENIYQHVSDAEKAAIWAAAKELHYIFHHALLRDAAYAMQMRARRKELHLLALSALESIFPEIPESRYAEFGYHAELGGNTEKARKYFIHAGKIAALLYQNELAVDYFTHAIKHTSVDDLAGQFDLLVERAELFSRLGRRELQFKDLDSLDRLAKQMKDTDRTARSLMYRATYYYFLGNYQNAIDQIEELQSVADASIMETELGLYTQVVWCMSLLYLGKVGVAMMRAQSALKLSRKADNKKEECRILTAMGLIALEDEVPARAHEYLIAAVEIARVIKDMGLEARALNNLAKAESSVNGNYARAREYYEEVYSLARETGDRHAVNTALSSLGFIAGMQGDFPAAQSYHEQSLRTAREIGSPFLEMYTLINLSAVAGIGNEADTALRFSQEAAELSQKITQPSGEAWAMLYMGHAYLLQGEFQAARDAYQRSIDIRDQLNQVGLSMEPIAGFVETYLKENDIESASREVEKILQFLDSGSTLDGTEEPLRIYHACCMLLERKKDPRFKQVLQKASELLETQISKFSDDTARRRFIENIPWRNAIYVTANR